MSTIENIVKSLAYATEHNQGLHLTHEEVPALNACIAQLEAEIRNWQDCYCEFETIAPDGKLKISVLDIYNRIAELNDRIAELEAEIDQLTAHSDIERQDDKSPNDTQTSTIVYGKEREE